MVTVRLEPELKDAFVRIAESHGQSASEALRSLIQRYVDEARHREITRQIANIRANSDEEAEAMQWIAAYGARGGD